MPNIQWHIGCSGFSYKEWKDIFYPPKLPQRAWFTYYTTHFNTLELNVTFYRIPTLKSLKGWFDAAPPNFVFSAKVHRSITHYKKLDGLGSELKDFYALLREGLGEKLGCVLFQMPPQFSYTDDRLQKVLACPEASFKNVFEFRHESWWREDVRQALAAAGLCFSGVSFPKISRDEAITDLPLSYYRFHGVPHLFYSKYDESFVRSVFQQVTEMHTVSTAFMYFNNTASAAALQNARYLQSLASGNEAL
jgi:uncharacterized protein YecE (DUF72 family)